MDPPVYATLFSSANKLTNHQTNVEQQNNLDSGYISCCGNIETTQKHDVSSFRETNLKMLHKFLCMNSPVKILTNLRLDGA